MGLYKTSLLSLLPAEKSFSVILLFLRVHLPYPALLPSLPHSSLLTLSVSQVALGSSNPLWPPSLGTCPSSACKLLLLLLAGQVPAHSPSFNVGITAPLQGLPATPAPPGPPCQKPLFMYKSLGEHSCLWRCCYCLPPPMDEGAP